TSPAVVVAAGQDPVLPAGLVSRHGEKLHETEEIAERGFLRLRIAERGTRIEIPNPKIATRGIATHHDPNPGVP
ncbi:MAG TPA: hypothetical protein VF507_09630, partial [Pyrinomonadaceae bacterium]